VRAPRRCLSPPWALFIARSSSVIEWICDHYRHSRALAGIRYCTQWAAVARGQARLCHCPYPVNVNRLTLRSRYTPLPMRSSIRVSVRLLLAATAIGCLSSAWPAPSEPAAAADTHAPAAVTDALPADTASRDIGLMIGTQLATSGLSPALSREALVRGINDALDGRSVSADQKEAALHYIASSRATFARHNEELSRQFLAQNARASGIRQLPSGLQYRILQPGDPRGRPPGAHDQITLRYRASLADGTEIDRSDTRAQPASFRLDFVIQGWREALSAMTPGAKWQVYVPPELAYGSNAPPPIPPGALLVYELELLSIEPAKPLSRGK